MKTATLFKTLKDHHLDINVVAVSPDGGTLASGDDGRIVKLWDIKSGELLHTFDLHQGRIVRWHFPRMANDWPVAGLMKRFEFGILCRASVCS